MGKVKAVILVGGPSKATRFRPLSFDVPKPLFPIAGKPILSHHLQACKKVPNLQEIILIGFYEPAQFETFIEASQKELEVPIRYLNEEESLDTGGGLRKFKDEILKDSDEDVMVLVLHGDIMCSFPLAEMVDFHSKHPKACTVLGKAVPPADVHQYGILIQNDSSHQVVHYTEKPATSPTDRPIASCGVYVFSQKLFELLDAAAEENKAHASDDAPLSFLLSQQDITVHANGDVSVKLEKQVLAHMAAAGDMWVYETHDWWMQLKNASMAIRCNELLMDHYKRTGPSVLAMSPRCEPDFVGNVIVDATASVHPTAKIGPNVSIGKDVKIGAGVRIVDSIILDGVVVKDRACVIKSIIGWNSVVGQWTRIEGKSPSSTDDLHAEPSSGGITMFGNNVNAAPEIIIRECVVLPHKSVSSSVHNEVIL